MKQPTIHTNIHEAKVILYDLAEEDRIVVVREAQGGDEESLRKALEQKIRVALNEARKSWVSIPKLLQNTDDARAWVANVIQEAELDFKTQQAIRSLEKIAPQFMKQRIAEAKVAAKKLPDHEHKKEELSGKLSDAKARLELIYSKHGFPRLLRAEKRKWQLGLAVMWLLESMLTYSAVASYYGYFSGPMRYVTPNEWFQVLIVAGPATVVLFLLAKFVSSTIQYIRISLRALKRLVVVLITCTVLFGFSIGMLRLVAGLSDESLTGAFIALGNNALGLISFVGVLVVAVGAIWCERMVANLNKQLSGLRGAEETHQKTTASLQQDWNIEDAQLTRLREIEELPDSLRTAFESGVQQMVRQLHDEQAEVENRLTQACAALRKIQPLPQVVLQDLIDDCYYIERKGSKLTQRRSTTRTKEATA